jgi:AmiR/NasT family two-component response regulator
VLAGLRLREDFQWEIDKYAALLDERRTVARAKHLLQQRLAWDEEQAYLYLRNAIGRNRKPMREVAQDVIERGAERLERLRA